MSRPSYFEPYQVPPGYFDEEILLLEGVRKHADAHGNTDVLLVASDALDFVLEITSRKGTRETFISLIDLCTSRAVRFFPDKSVRDVFEKVLTRARSGLAANERGVVNESRKQIQN